MRLSCEAVAIKVQNYKIISDLTSFPAEKHKYGSDKQRYVKIFFPQPPLRIASFRAKRLLAEKNAFSERVGKLL